MRHLALISALYLTTTLCACAQPGPDGPPPGYGQAGQPGWAGGMQSASGQAEPPGPQGAMPPDQGPPPGGAPGMVGSPGMGAPHVRMADKFAAANVTHDGRLTLQQAQAGGMMGVVRHFQQIDRDQKGYVTLQDIKQWHQEMRAAKMGARSGVPNGPGPASYPPLQGGQMAPGQMQGQMQGQMPPGQTAPQGGQQY